MIKTITTQGNRRRLLFREDEDNLSEIIEYVHSEISNYQNLYLAKIKQIDNPNRVDLHKKLWYPNHSECDFTLEKKTEDGEGIIFYGLSKRELSNLNRMIEDIIMAHGFNFLLFSRHLISQDEARSLLDRVVCEGEFDYSTITNTDDILIVRANKMGDEEAYLWGYGYLEFIG